jgi:hypothetical protein
MSTRRFMAIVGMGATILGILHVRTGISQSYTGVYEQDFASVLSAKEAEWMVPDGTYCERACGSGMKCCSGGGISLD